MAAISRSFNTDDRIEAWSDVGARDVDDGGRMQRSEIAAGQIKLRHAVAGGTERGLLHRQIIVNSGTQAASGGQPLRLLVALRVPTGRDLAERHLRSRARLFSGHLLVIANRQTSSATLRSILCDPCSTQPRALTAQSETESFHFVVEVNFVARAGRQFESGDVALIELHDNPPCFSGKRRGSKWMLPSASPRHFLTALISRICAEVQENRAS